MSDRKLTFFELHFDGPLRIGPSFGDDPAPELDATDGEGRAEKHVSIESGVDADDEGGAPVKGAIVGVLLLVLLAVAARVLLGGDDDVDDVEMVELEDDDDVEIAD
ncbi:hypothetical protein G9C85_03655 [Halorubellus sp. JP-L1]|uniref:hypothetical protein n=1 Tax=Halorubellus sp. JP-L1 TaxID=2715753 RepID=UPI0014091D60|nr:hypothetical protein [Halorubellus sp. JP-L1]NHN40732.1 hypothetical protein [Halorubellus sp. JP-L1]